jgi:MFS family permease
MSGMRRNAALFVAISLVSGFGSTAMSLVAGIWILDLTGSVSLAGLAGLCVYLPTLAAPWLGGLVDRLPRRPLVITMDLLLAAALLTLPAVRSRDDTWLLFAVMAAYGISYVLTDAGESALLPAALPPSRLADVNGWRTSAQEGMKLVAPAAGAGIYAWHGGAAVALVSAAMPLVVAFLYTRLRLPARPGREPDGRDRGAGMDAQPGSDGRDRGAGMDAPPAPDAQPAPDARHPRAGTGARAGLAVLWGVPEIRTPVLVAALAIGLSGFTVAAVYARVTGDLDLPSTFLGVLGSAQGAGSILGGLAVGRLVTRTGAATVAAVGAALFGVGCLFLCLPWWPVVIGGSLTVGIGLPWTLIAAVTAVQSRTPDHLLGRVAATANTAMFGPIALTNPLGAAAVHLGPRVPLITAAGLALGAAAVVLRGRGRGGQNRDERMTRPMVTKTSGTSQ